MNSLEYGPNYLIEADWISPSHCLDIKIIRMRAFCFVLFCFFTEFVWQHDAFKTTIFN